MNVECAGHSLQCHWPARMNGVAIFLFRRLVGLGFLGPAVQDPEFSVSFTKHLEVVSWICALQIGNVFSWGVVLRSAFFRIVQLPETLQPRIMLQCQQCWSGPPLCFAVIHDRNYGCDSIYQSRAG